MRKFPALPLKSHHITIQLAGDSTKIYRLIRALIRLSTTPHARHFLATVRCASRTLAELVIEACRAEGRLKDRAVVDVCHHQGGRWVSRRVVWGPGGEVVRGEEEEEEPLPGPHDADDDVGEEVPAQMLQVEEGAHQQDQEPVGGL